MMEEEIPSISKEAKKFKLFPIVDKKYDIISFYGKKIAKEVHTTNICYTLITKKIVNEPYKLISKDVENILGEHKDIIPKTSLVGFTLLRDFTNLID